MDEKKEDKRPHILPSWLVASISSATTGLLIFFGMTIRDVFYPMVNVLSQSLSKEKMLGLIGVLTFLLFCLVCCILKLRSYCAAPFSERFKFDPIKGFHVDKSGFALCPICLNSGGLTRIRFFKTGSGLCGEHRSVYGPCEEEPATK